MRPAHYPGRHNANLEVSRERLIRGQSYKDLSTICVIPVPARDEHAGMIPMRVCQALWGLMVPMNQKFFRLPVEGMEVGDAYNHAVEQILAHPELSKWRYLLTVEHDNLPPPDALLKLYESIDKFDAVGGLYWTKGEGGQPMIYGNPAEMPRNYVPQLPIPDQVQECNGLGMGFTLFKLAMFKKIEKPWFKTVQDYAPNVGVSQGTQDLYFFGKAAGQGYRFASDNRVKVGHLDPQTGEIW